MSEETDVAAQRYSRDLRRIREERGVSIEDIHEQTRIALTLIESFEDGSLYDHPSFNRIYLRSFIRVYAEAIDLPPEEALDSLEAAFDGSYQHEMADRYLREDLTETVEDPSSSDRDASDKVPDDETEDSEPSSSDPADSSDSLPDSTPPAGGPAGRGGIVGPARAIGQDSGESSDEEKRDPQQPESSPEQQGAADGEQEAFRSSTEPSSGKQEESSFSDWSEEEGASHSDSRDESDQGFDRPQELPSEEDKKPTGTSQWSAENQEASSSQKEPTPEESASPSAADAGDEGDPHLGGAVSGIVGGPKELGSSSDPQSASGSAEPSPVDPSRPSSPSSSSGSEGLGAKRRKIVLSAVGVLILIGVLTGLTLYYSSTESSAEGAERSAQTEDTTQTVAVQDTSAPSSSSDRPDPASLTLGDTLRVTVFAESNLTEIRVQRDGDLRRPYWIEQGEAAVFPFTRRITFENDLNDARFLLEGYAYPSPARDNQGRIVIDRSTVESFADTLRGQPQSLPVTPDTIPIGSPVPEDLAE